MGLTLRERRALARIRDDLGSDSRLASQLEMFTRLAADDDMPRHERIGLPRPVPAPARQPDLMSLHRSAPGAGRPRDGHRWQLAGLLLSLAAAIGLLTSALVTRGAAPAGCLAAGTIACAGQWHQRGRPALPLVRVPGAGPHQAGRPPVPSAPGAGHGGS